MIYDEIVELQGEKMLCLDVRKTHGTKIMIQGDKESLLFLSDYIKHHANSTGCCWVDVPLNVNLVSGKLYPDEFELFLHRLPCTEEDC